MFRYVERGYIRTDYKVVKVTMADHDRDKGGTQGTNTGRLSAGFLQGLKKDKAFRSPFVAPDGWLFLELDYATLEPRVLAHIAGIREWQIWFERGYDLYCGMANQMEGLGVNIDHHDHAAVARELKACISKEYRDKVMKRNFLAQMYMQGAASLAEATGMSLTKTEQWSENFHRSFPQLKRLQATLWENMCAGLPVITPFGRQAYADLPAGGDPNRDEKMAAIHRHFWNLPVQATGSDSLIWLVWNFMRALKTTNRWGGPRTRLHGEDVPIEVIEKKTGVRVWGAVCNLIHDAALSLVRVEHFTRYARALAGEMEDRTQLPFKMSSPYLVEGKAGKYFAHMKDVDHKTWELPKGWDEE